MQGDFTAGECPPRQLGEAAGAERWDLCVAHCPSRAPSPELADLALRRGAATSRDPELAGGRSHLCCAHLSPAPSPPSPPGPLLCFPLASTCSFRSTRASGGRTREWNRGRPTPGSALLRGEVQFSSPCPGKSPPSQHPGSPGPRLGEFSEDPRSSKGWDGVLCKSPQFQRDPESLPPVRVVMVRTPGSGSPAKTSGDRHMGKLPPSQVRALILTDIDKLRQDHGPQELGDRAGRMGGPGGLTLGSSSPGRSHSSTRHRR